MSCGVTWWELHSSLMASSEQHLIRRVGVAFATLYLVVAASFAVRKAYHPALQHRPLAEIAFGPAITVACSFLLFCAAVRVECWVRDRT